MASVAKAALKHRGSSPRLLIKAARSALRRRLLKMNDVVNALVARNKVVAAFYYAFYNHEMLREMQSVSAGILRYRADNASDTASDYLLRRNTHRLEKGLIMRPRRAVFALDFIGETVEAFVRANRTSCGTSTEEMIWAADVLTDYFDAVDGGNPVVARADRMFKEVSALVSEPARSRRSVPYARDLSVPPPVDFDAFLALVRRRRSVRWFEQRKVDRVLVDSALTAAAQSPSACNRQPFHFRIFDESAAVQEVISIPMGTKGFSENVPAVAVIVGQLRAYPFERDRHVIYIDGALAAMTFMLSLETLGIASCPINWPDQEPHESRMKKRLGLADDERVIMLIAFGWPDPEGKVPFSTKRSVGDLRTFN